MLACMRCNSSLVKAGLLYRSGLHGQGSARNGAYRVWLLAQLRQARLQAHEAYLLPAEALVGTRDFKLLQLRLIKLLQKECLGEQQGSKWLCCQRDKPRLSLKC